MVTLSHALSSRDTNKGYHESMIALSSTILKYHFFEISEKKLMQI